MLLDVPERDRPILVAVGYGDDRGHAVGDFPASLADLERCRPVYRTLRMDAGHHGGARRWGCRRRRGRMSALAEQVGVPVSLVSVGPDRTQTIAHPGSDATLSTIALKVWNGSARSGSGPSSCPGVAIIMDGNGRWARRWGKPRIVEDIAGNIQSVRAVIEEGKTRARPVDALPLDRELEAAPRELSSCSRLLRHFLVAERRG